MMMKEMKSQGLSLLQVLQEASAKEILASLQKKYPDRQKDVDIVASSGNPPALWPVIMKLLVQSKEPVSEVLSLVVAFNRVRTKLQKKDLALYKDTQEIREVIEATAPSQTSMRNEFKGQVEKVYEDDKFVVIYPHSKQASCVWGSGTTWCTAATQSTNYFPYYTGAGNKLYYLITKGMNPKSNPNAKMSLGFGTNGKFSGGQDGGLSVDANNTGITLTDVDSWLTQQSDKATANKIINAVARHVKSSGDHPLKGFYDKALQDPAAHRKYFDDAMSGTSPETYVAMLLFVNHEDVQSYEMFGFDMCVYVNQLLRKYGFDNESMLELFNGYTPYGSDKFTAFPLDVDRGKLDDFISSAWWVLNEPLTMASNVAAAPVIWNVDTIKRAFDILLMPDIDLSDTRLQKLYRARFLDQHQWHNAIRTMALDEHTSEFAVDRCQQILEMFLGDPANAKTVSDLIIHRIQYSGNAHRLAGWFYTFGGEFSPGRPTNGAIEDVITNLIIPHRDELIASGLPILDKMLSISSQTIEDLFEPMYQLFVAFGDETNTNNRTLYSLLDKLLYAGLKTLSPTNFNKVMHLIDVGAGAQLDNQQVRRWRLEDVIDNVDLASTSDLSVRIMRKIAEIARSVDADINPKSRPSYSTKWWNSPSLPPEYAAFETTYKPADPNDPFLPWPPPALAPVESQTPATLSEMLFGCKLLRRHV